MSSGCLWGMVRDAETGDPIAGAEISYTDMNGNSGTTTTVANGIYAFDQASVIVPAAGPVSFDVKAVGYRPQTAARLVEYNDSNGSFANLSTFWEVQHFSMTSAGMKISNAELLEVDFDKVKAPPLIPGAYARFRLTLRAYGAADPVNPSCEQTSAPHGPRLPSSSPVEPVAFGCITPGKDLLVSVTVIVERAWPSRGGWLADEDVSTTTTGWITSTNDWQEVDLDSTDTSGPDDSDLEFHATVRYKTSTLVPLRCEE